MCEELKTAKGRTGRREDYELSPPRMIHILSHVMKRSSGLPQEVEGLTPMQGHVLKYILIMTMQKNSSITDWVTSITLAPACAHFADTPARIPTRSFPITVTTALLKGFFSIFSFLL